MAIPGIPANIVATAAQVWSDSILAYGKDVQFKPKDGSTPVTRKALCRRPKIMGLFDRTEQSYDQERYVVMVRAQDIPGGEVEKFDRVRWDSEDHVVLSVTQVELMGTVFGFRILVKG